MFEIIAIEAVDIAGPASLRASDLLSPFVWPTPDGRLAVLLRVIPLNPGDDPITGVIWYGSCDKNGLCFRMEDQPLLVPGPGPLDIGGCEDPTVVPAAENETVVYYTGLDQNGDGQMLYATGPDVRHLIKRGVALASSKTERNTKEATVERTEDGEWRLFYEYSRDNKSRVGLAHGPGPHGPWSERHDPFEARPDHWDCWHLSTGPLLMTDPNAPVMFYNGADRDAVWGIGWVVFNRELTRVVARSDDPLIGPPKRLYHGRDISFSASVVEHDDEIWLYFSRNDHRAFRARIRRSQRPA